MIRWLALRWHSELQRLGDVVRLDVIRAREICDRPRHLSNTIVAPRTQGKTTNRRIQQAARGEINRAVLRHQLRRQLRIGADTVGSIALFLRRARGDDARTHRRRAFARRHGSKNVDRYGWNFDREVESIT